MCALEDTKLRGGFVSSKRARTGIPTPGFLAHAGNPCWIADTMRGGQVIPNHAWGFVFVLLFTVVLVCLSVCLRPSVPKNNHRARLKAIGVSGQGYFF